MPQNPSSSQILIALLTLTLYASIVAAWGWAIARLAAGRTLLPAPSRDVVGWGGRTVLAVLATYLVLQVAVIGLYVQLLGVARPAPGAGLTTTVADRMVEALLHPLVFAPGQLVVVTVSLNVMFLAVAPILLARGSGTKTADFGFGSGEAGSDVLRGLMAWPLLAPIVFGVNALATGIWKDRIQRHPLQDWVESAPSTSTLFLAAFSAVVVAPLAEEFLFRSVLLGWLDKLAIGPHEPGGPVAWRKRLGPREEVDELEDRPDPAEMTHGSKAGIGFRLFAANVVVSLLFAALHGQVWPTPVPLFFLSLGLGLLYQRTGRLLASITLHATFNGIATLTLYLSLLG